MVAYRGSRRGGEAGFRASKEIDIWMPGSHPLESFGTAGGHLDPVRRRRERLAHLPPDQGRVVRPGGNGEGAAAGSTDFHPFRNGDDGAGTPFAIKDDVAFAPHLYRPLRPAAAFPEC